PEALSVVIRPSKDVDVTHGASGKLTASAGTQLFIGSEETLRIDRIEAGGDAIVKVQQSLVDARPGNGANIISGNLILEGELGNIGTSASPLVVQLHPGATFIARAADSIYVDFASDARLISVNAADEVRLRGTGSLLDADNDDASGSAWNITTETLILDVEGSIGSGTGYLEIALGGTLTATAGGSIHLHEVAQEGLDGTMEINQVVAEGASGVARLKADGSIVDAGAPLVDVKGNSIVLTAGEFGFIGLSTN